MVIAAPKDTASISPAAAVGLVCSWLAVMALGCRPGPDEPVQRTPEKRGFAAFYRSNSLLPTRVEEHAGYQDALAAELAAQVRALHGVVEAHVLVTLPLADPLAPDRGTRSAPSVSLVAGLVPKLDRDRLRQQIIELTTAAVPNLAAAEVTVVFTSATPPCESPEVELVELGPIVVARSSKVPLQLIAAGGLLVIIALAIWLVFAERTKAALLEKPP